MSNRLGRNPLQAKKAPKKVPKTAREIITESVETQVSVAQIKETPKPRSPKTPVEKLLHWFLVDIPADSYVFALKSVLLIKAVLE
jgi:hypothetical protein